MQEEQPIQGLSIEETRFIKNERAELSRAKYWFPITAVLNLVFFYGIALGVWGLAVGINFLWATLAGVLAGLLIAFTFCLSAIFSKSEDMQHLEDRSFFVGVWIKVGLAIIVPGLVVWVIRILFH